MRRTSSQFASVGFDVGAARFELGLALVKLRRLEAALPNDADLPRMCDVTHGMMEQLESFLDVIAAARLAYTED